MALNKDSYTTEEGEMCGLCHCLLHTGPCGEPATDEVNDVRVEALEAENAALRNRVLRLEAVTVDEMFAALTQEQREDVLSKYCRFCLGDDPRCVCWNDD